MANVQIHIAFLSHHFHAILNPNDYYSYTYEMNRMHNKSECYYETSPSQTRQHRHECLRFRHGAHPLANLRHDQRGAIMKHFTLAWSICATLALVAVLTGQLQPRYCVPSIIGDNNQDVVSLIDAGGRKH